MKLPKKEKILKIGIKRRKNHLYFIDKDGNVSEVAMRRGDKNNKNSQIRVVYKSNIIKESRYLYFLDADGDIGRVESTRGSLNADERKKLKDRKKKILSDAKARNKRENRYID